jgi:hypothetical protein
VGGRVAQGQEGRVGLGDRFLLNDFVEAIPGQMGMWRVGKRVHAGLLFVGHAQEVHLAEERLAEDEDPDDVLGRMRVGKVAAHHLLLVEIVHLPLVTITERLDRRGVRNGSGGEIAAVDVAPRAHVLSGVTHTVGPKRTGVRAREVRTEHGGVEVPHVLPPVARVVPHARAMEGVHELLRGAPVERQRAMAWQVGHPGPRPGWVVALTLTLTLTLALALALALAALALAWVGSVRIRMERRRRVYHR